ncbi:MAG: EAL domain-containing protein [Chloroflexi bacterium]|nr:EAL domain-containing protein [Chloroflexota bacterium]
MSSPEFLRAPTRSFEFLFGPLALGALALGVIGVAQRRGYRELAKRVVEHNAELAEANERLRLQAVSIASAANAIFITDRRGRIEWVNAAFTQLSGYSAAEAVGQTPRLLKSGAHDPLFYADIWQTILAGEIWRGEVVERRKNGSLYTVRQTITPLRDAHGAVSHFVAIHEDITAQKQAEERIRHLAHYDALTDLPNRVLFRDRLHQAIAQARRFERLVGVAFVDLDRFKTINDTLGHDVGDLLLKAVARRLTGCLRAGDTVARLAGDEFTLILPGLAEARDAGAVAQRILDSLAQPFRLGGYEAYTGASIGIALYPLDATDPDRLVTNADATMYRAKEQGGNCYQFFTAEISARAIERLALESSLRHAVERNELVLHYQPQVDATTGQIVGMEALLRWQHPRLGPVLPAQFIPIAEETGLIVPIGEWVLRTACRQNRAWQEAGFPPLRVAVNLSTRQFKRDVVGTVARVLEETGLDPGYLELEITESVIVQEAEAVGGALHALKAMGVRLSIDDFGTRYSSLAYLKRFPIDTLKIDRSFVRDITTDRDDAAIATAIIALAQRLELKVVAEGVEEPEQVRFLRAHGCTEIQGYLCSRPLPAGEMARLLAVGHSWPNL